LSPEAVTNKKDLSSKTHPCQSKFGLSLLKLRQLNEKAQKYIQNGLDRLDDVIGKRTRAIKRRLHSLELLNEEEAKFILPDISYAELLDDKNDNRE
jgi:hypothetical protein